MTEGRKCPGVFYCLLPGGHGDSPQVEVVPDRVLEVVVYPALGEPGVQVLAQITGDGA